MWTERERHSVGKGGFIGRHILGMICKIMLHFMCALYLLSAMIETAAAGAPNPIFGNVGMIVPVVRIVEPNDVAHDIDASAIEQNAADEIAGKLKQTFPEILVVPAGSYKSPPPGMSSSKVLFATIVVILQHWPNHSDSEKAIGALGMELHRADLEIRMSVLPLELFESGTDTMALKLQITEGIKPLLLRTLVDPMMSYPRP